jgi:hypothetical protein
MKKSVYKKQKTHLDYRCFRYYNDLVHPKEEAMSDQDVANSAIRPYEPHRSRRKTNINLIYLLLFGAAFCGLAAVVVGAPFR